MSFVTGVPQQRQFLMKILKNVYRQQINNRHHRCHTSKTQVDLSDSSQNKVFEFHRDWPTDMKNEFQRDMLLIENFVTEEEEERLCAEAEKSMKRMRYQYDHWDDAIHGYREMEKVDWWPENGKVFERIRNRAFFSNVLPHVHILDLAADGIIKPHVDSSRYCGSTIAGLSLLSQCIIRLKRVDENQYKQSKQGEDETHNETEQESKIDGKSQISYFVDILLRRRSLYIMKDSARYKFSHEVLASKSKFMDNEIIKDRRLSIICRNKA